MCGSESRLLKAEIEGTLLNVCGNCSKFGKVKARVFEKGEKPKKTFYKRPQRKSIEEVSETIVEDYSNIIKEKREKLGLKQEDLAKNLNEKLSIIHKMETGHFEPSIKLAKKLESFLKITLIEQIGDEKIEQDTTESDSFTLGDFIKVRK